MSTVKRVILLASRAQRRMTTAAGARAPKEEGSIASVFSSLSGDAGELPPRFAALKREMWREALVQSWREVTAALEGAVEEVAAKGANIIPRVSYKEVREGFKPERVAEIKKRGVVIVEGGVPKEEALAWKQSLRDYIAANKPLVKGYPADNIQAFEIYNSPAQTKARTHPAVSTTQRALLALWHASDTGTPLSLRTPIAYFDRFRMRVPGDAAFVLGPHIDGGSVERWEDPGFRACFAKILEGRWREHDPFDATPRIGANQDLYHAANQCSIFRPWQGWTSLSRTGPREGTLRVLPLLPLATAYITLRPFFRPGPRGGDWEVDLDSTAFPGSRMGKTQELSDATHPHLQLARTMVSAPRVEPGDQIYWHCDVVHAVEGVHEGASDSSVLYIPAVPLTSHNASYLRDQRNNFVAGLPAPDFPGGEGETKFVGRGTVEDAQGVEGRRMLGFEKFEISDGMTGAEKSLIEEANQFDDQTAIVRGVYLNIMVFPGSFVEKAQELGGRTHLHLREAY